MIDSVNFFFQLKKYLKIYNIKLTKKLNLNTFINKGSPTTFKVESFNTTYLLKN